MGNSNQKSVDIKKLVKNYTPGDIETFKKIMDETPKTYKNVPSFKAWSLACLQYYITHLEDDQHDIAENDASILRKYQELEAQAFGGLDSDDPEQRKISKEMLECMYIATGIDKYDITSCKKVVFE